MGLGANGALRAVPRMADKQVVGSKLWNRVREVFNWAVPLVFVAHVAAGLYFWHSEMPVFVLGWVVYWCVLLCSKTGREAGPQWWAKLAVTGAAGFAGAVGSLIVYGFLGLNMLGS